MARASSERPSATGEWSIRNILDNNPKTAWMPDSSDLRPWIEFSFPRKVRIQGIATRNGLHRTLSDQMNEQRSIGRASNKSYIAKGIRPSINSKFRSRDGWDTGQAFHWDGASATSMDHYLVNMFREFKNRFLFTFDSIPLRSSPAYFGASPVAVSDICLLDNSSQSYQCVPQPLRTLESTNALDSLKKWKPRIQNLYSIKDWAKNVRKWGEGILDGDPPEDDKIYYLLDRKSNNSRDFYEEYIRLKRLAWDKPLYFQLTFNENKSWQATFPFFYWENVPNQFQSNPVIEGIGDSITFLRISNGTYPERSPEIEHLNSEEQSRTIDEPAHDPDTTSVRIGNQIWMKHNLSKSPVDDKALCWGLTIEQAGKWNNNCKEYGRLYPAIEARNICPEGWHLPSWREWAKLFGHLNQVKQGKINKRFLWFWLMSPGRWYSGEPGMDPLGFSAKYFSRPPIGPLLTAYEFPTFLASDPWGWAFKPWNSHTDQYGIVIDLEDFPGHLNDSFDAITGDIPSGITTSNWEPAFDYAPVRCLKNQ